MEKTKAWGIASVILGSFSVLLFLAPYFALPMAILAIVFSRKQQNIAANGTATAGLVTGIIGIVINSITGIIVLIMLALGMF